MGKNVIFPDVPSKTYTVPSVNGVTPNVGLVQYIGNGEWIGLLDWSSIAEEGQIYPMAFSTKRGFIFPALFDSSIYDLSATCYNPETNLLMLSNLGFYKTNNGVINQNNEPVIPVNYPASSMYNCVFTDNCLLASPQNAGAVYSYNFSTKKIVGFSTDLVNYSTFWQVLPLGKNGVAFFDSYYNFWYAPLASELNNATILKKYGIEAAPIMAPVGKGIMVLYGGSLENAKCDVFFDGIEYNINLLPTSNLSLYIGIGSGYIMDSKNVYCIFSNRVLANSEIIDSDSVFYVICDNYVAYFEGASNYFRIYTLPKIPSVISRDPRLTLSNYSRRWINT
jgi:hypothetical protein